MTYQVFLYLKRGMISLFQKQFGAELSARNLTPFLVFALKLQTDNINCYYLRDFGQSCISTPLIQT